MTETLNDALNAALDAGDNAEATPEPTPAPAAETPAAETPGTETPSGEGAADFLGEKGFDWGKLDPNLTPLAKQLQADYTRKTMELAEQRKAFAEVDQSALQWTNHVRELAQTDPAQAAALLRQQAEQLVPQGQAPAQMPEFATEVERLLWERDQMREREVQELRMARLAAEVERSFDRLEKTYNRPISPEERNLALTYAAQNQIRDVGMAWKVMNFENARRWGRDEGASVVQQKVGLGAAPTGIANREAAAGPAQPKTLQEAIGLALDGVEL